MQVVLCMRPSNCNLKVAFPFVYVNCRKLSFKKVFAGISIIFGSDRSSRKHNVSCPFCSSLSKFVQVFLSLHLTSSLEHTKAH